MLERIRGILEEYVEMPGEMITMETTFSEDLGLSSLDVVDIIMAFEEEFDVEIPDRMLSKIVKVEDVVELLRELREVN